MHTLIHCIHIYIDMHTNMHTGYMYKYVYIHILLLNPYAAYFNHLYECEGNRMAQAPHTHMHTHKHTHTHTHVQAYFQVDGPYRW